jgi:hypothetical protein
MAYPDEIRAAVRARYIEGLPLSGAAVTASVPYDTARAWKKAAQAAGDDWDTARAAYQVSEQGIEELNKQMVEGFARQMVTTGREIEESRLTAADKARLLSGLADAYSKFGRAFARINPAYSGLSVAMDTLKTLADHIAARDKEALKALVPHLEAVGVTLSKRYGKGG